ncbi:MAG: diadenosine tetraphosphatase [Acidobacteria bacterium]|nr:diadenosine tetraphosphatase [Acidobacteriota bacterium]
MATWAIGDVHGCFRTLEALIERIDPDVTRDRLWMVGDLVNRGPSSLSVLRWARALEEEMSDRFQVVLGNHDLHLIARHRGLASARPGDTLDDVLQAADGPDLVEWLRRRPFIHFGGTGDDDFVLVHAGLLPGWSRRDATMAAQRLERQLQGPDPERLLHSRDDEALAAFTRMRMLDPDAGFHDHNGAPEAAPAGLSPWFEVEPRGCPGHTAITGHWAALGMRLRPDLIALDSGCVWGGRLTAVRLEDRRVVQKRVADPL